MIEENSEGEQNDSQELSDSDEEVEFKEMNLKIAKDEKSTPKISISLISKTSIEKEIFLQLKEHEKVDYICKVKKVHLEWLGIVAALEKIENLNFLENLQILFLQHNNIEKIENLDTLVHLEYLSLKANKIKTLERVKNLKKLSFFDISENLLKKIDVLEIPKNLEFFNLNENLLLREEYKKDVILYCENLLELDGETITAEIRFKFLNIFPKNLEGYAQSLKVFQEEKKTGEFNESFDHEFVPIDGEVELDILANRFITEADNLKDDIHKKTINVIAKAKEKCAEQIEEHKKEIEEVEEMHKILIKTIRNSSKYFTADGKPKKQE